MFASKLLAMGDAAANKFDAEMKRREERFQTGILKGQQITTKALAKLAKEDVDLAIQEMSRLYSTGQLSFETVSKMFG